ncbi:MAG: hypothetical protein IJX35_00365 [Candidatus Methanomethylophilaceae archaeon]|nr:hypothetical protein [Candidatus Methanomethylophilaceae archaeon]
MNEIDLAPQQSEEVMDDREASPMLIFLGALSIASVLSLFISYALEHSLIFILSVIFTPVFLALFGLEYYDVVHFTFGNEYDPEPEPTYEELHDPEDCTDRSDNIIPPFRLNPTLGWTCSYCGVTNVWNPKHQGAVYCTHCGAKYENDELKTL